MKHLSIRYDFLVPGSQSRSVGLEKNMHTKTLRPRGSIHVGSNFIQTCSCCKSVGGSPGWGEGTLIPVSVLFAVLALNQAVSRRLAAAASCLSLSALHWNATVRSSIDTRESKQGAVLEASLP